MYLDLHKTCADSPAKTVLFAVGFGAGAFLLRRYVQKYFQRRRLETLVENKRKFRKENADLLRSTLVSPSSEVQTKREAIINSDFETLRSALQNDQYTPTEVLNAFQARALKANDLTNCVCEFLIEASLWAEDLEHNFYKSDKKPLLYGIPISVKESNKMKGHDSTAGFAKFINQPCDVDSALVVALKDLGAVPFVLTNVPQSMVSLGCSNPVYGSTLNPFDTSRSPGGSSGGEGALIGLRGSPLGIGTDVGGSVRVPAHFCGIYAIKPTVARMPQSGRRGAVPGLSAILSTGGPMGVDVDSLIWFLRSLWATPSEGRSNSMFDRNPYVVPLPFNETMFSSKSKLTIGYYDFDGFLEAVPACRRAVDLVKTVLQDAGHTVVKFDPPEVPHLYRLYMGSVLPDGGRCLQDAFYSDIIDRFHVDMAQYTAISLRAKRRLGRVLSLFKPRTAAPYLAQAQDTNELRDIFARLGGYKEKFAEIWLDAKLDCVVCPVLASPAMPEALPSLMFKGGWSYCGLYNALDYPSGVLPVTTVNEQDELGLESYPTTDAISSLVKRGARGSVGLPVGVQIVSLPYHEELCLRVMKEVESLLKIKKK